MPRIEMSELERQKLAKAGAESIRPSGWQPIETAPKDGTNILVAVFESNGFYWGQDIVVWNETNGWDSAGYDWPPNVITHWMPLPEPPK